MANSQEIYKQMGLSLYFNHSTRTEKEKERERVRERMCVNQMDALMYHDQITSLSPEDTAAV